MKSSAKNMWGKHGQGEGDDSLHKNNRSKKISPLGYISCELNPDFS